MSVPNQGVTVWNFGRRYGQPWRPTLPHTIRFETRDTAKLEYLYEGPFSTKPVRVERIQKKGCAISLKDDDVGDVRVRRALLGWPLENRMEEANSLGLSRGDEVECYMTYLKRRDQVKMMGLGQRAKVLLLHSHVGNISTRTFPLDSWAFTDSNRKKNMEKKNRSWWSLRG